MVRLPGVFHDHDKELHALFYFGAAIISNLLYPKKWHLIALIFLLFGITIELLQHFSNRVFDKIIHGNFDLQDIKFNIIGLTLGTLFSLLIQSRIKFKSKENIKQ
jgi:VanZ family protein